MEIKMLKLMFQAVECLGYESQRSTERAKYPYMIPWPSEMSNVKSYVYKTCLGKIRLHQQWRTHINMVND